jgi:hypothetical protein
MNKKLKITEQFKNLYPKDNDRSQLSIDLGIARSSLDRKMRDPSQFKRTEVEYLKKLTGLSSEQLFQMVEEKVTNKSTKATKSIVDTIIEDIKAGGEKVKLRLDDEWENASVGSIFNVPTSEEITGKRYTIFYNVSTYYKYEGTDGDGWHSPVSHDIEMQSYDIYIDEVIESTGNGDTKDVELSKKDLEVLSERLKKEIDYVEL